jgi:hypothetical protein
MTYSHDDTPRNADCRYDGRSPERWVFVLDIPADGPVLDAWRVPLAKALIVLLCLWARICSRRVG